MAIKLRSKKAIKKDEKEVELNLDEIVCDRTLNEIVQYEVLSMLKRLEFIGSKHNLKPILSNFKLSFEQITKYD